MSKNRRHITRCPMEEDTPLGALGAQGSSAKHIIYDGDSISGNASREVCQGAKLGIARVFYQIATRRNAVGQQVQLLLSEGALQTGTENIREPEVASRPSRQAAIRGRVGQLRSQAPRQRSTHATKPATHQRTNNNNLVIGPKVPALGMGI